MCERTRGVWWLLSSVRPWSVRLLDGNALQLLSLDMRPIRHRCTRKGFPLVRGRVRGAGESGRGDDKVRNDQVNVKCTFALLARTRQAAGLLFLMAYETGEMWRVSSGLK